MKSKLGFHVDIATHDGQIEKMISSDSRVIKVITSMGTLDTLHKALPKTTFVARDWKVSDDFLQLGGGDDPIGAAHRWFDGMLPAIVQAPFAYWEGPNEMSSWAHMDQYNTFEIERQRLMHEAGYKCCIGNFSGGSPEIVDPNDLWPKFYGALSSANAYGNILGLHEYGGLWMDMWYGPNQHDAVLFGNRVPFPQEYYEGWLFTRYRRVYNKHIKPNNWNNIKIVLTEFGLDRAATITTQALSPDGQATGPWKTCIPTWNKFGVNDAEAFYVDQLKWADQQMQKDDYLLGATIFTWGTLSPVWGMFDIEGKVADNLVEYIKNTQDDIEEPNITMPANVRAVAIETVMYMFGAPDLRSTRIKELHPGDLVELLTPTSKGIWSQVRSVDGKNGWVPSWILKELGVLEGFRLSWPTDYVVITQGFNLNPHWYSQYGLPGHEGIDIRAPLNANVYACADGIIYAAYESGAYGKQIRIDHGNGYKTVYAHLNTISVNVGDRVARRQVIGLANSTGNSTGHHLHLTLKHDGATARGETHFPNDIVDPTPYFK